MRRLRLSEGFFRDESGAPVYLIGANFWPKRTGPWMYRDAWDAAAVENDLRELASLGANVARIFCFLPDFMPAPDAIAGEAVGRLDATVELAARNGLWCIPTFLVGHMSGENFGPDWSEGRDWYADPLLLDASERLIRAVGARFADDPRIAAWLLTNEWPLFAGHTSDHQGLAWAKRMCAALRAVDSQRPISLGDGAWDVVNGQPNGLASAALRDVVDFFGPHFYPKQTDALRHSVFASFAMRMLEPLGKPVLLEEFGCSSDQSDDESAACYYRTVLWSAYGAGNCGALFWNSHDFTIADRAPYAHHPYELHFGVIRTSGERKPQALEVQRFARFAARHDPDDWQPISPAALIGRSSYYLTRYPFDWGWGTHELRDLYLQAFATCVMAGCGAGFVELASAAGSGARLLIVPCLQQVTTQDASAMEHYARDGGTVYLSYGGEPWLADLSSFTGTWPRIRYGLARAPLLKPLRLTFVRAFADIPGGTELSFPVGGDLRRRSALHCEPGEAEVIAHDQDGNPALFRRAVGSGRVFFLTYPLEYYGLAGHNANDDTNASLLYRALALDAGALAAVRARDALVQTFTWSSRSNTSRRRVLLVNHSWDAAETELLGVGGALSDVETGEQVNASVVRLESKGVRVLDTI